MSIFSPRWRKVLRDMASNKIRTVLVVLSIAVGVFAVGTIAGTQVILARDLTDQYLAINPASATLFVEGFDDDLVQTVRRMPGVREADAYRSVTVRLKIGPDQWRNLELQAFPNYDDRRVGKIYPERGAWPPPDKELLIERVSLPLTNAEMGDTVLVETDDGKQRQMQIAGLVHDINKPPASFVGTAYGYVTFDTLEWLGYDRSYDALQIVVAERPLDKEHIEAVGKEVKAKVEKGGRTVFWTWVPTPGQHPADDSVQPLLLILGVLGVLSLFLSGFLVVNTISALLTQQVRQIGVMKTIGARSGQIMRMYLVSVLLFGALALLIAVPLGALGAGAFTTYLAGLINFDVTSYAVPPPVLALEIAVGLIVPLLAALWPVVAGTRITVREAISSYGLGKGRFGRSWIDRLLERVRFLSRPLLLSLRNTFRRKGRLALTLFTLTLGGGIFIAVLSVQASLLLTLDDALAYWKSDVEMNFTRAYRVSQIQQEALKVPGVVAAESWGFQSVRRVRANDTESGNVLMIAPPAETVMLQPILLEGRWLLPDDENAVVINTDLVKDEPDLKVGMEMVLKLDGRESTWRVVGLVKGVLAGPFVYANYPYYAEVARQVGQASTVRVITDQHDLASQQRVARVLKDHFEAIGMQVGSTDTTAEQRERIALQFNIIVVFLLIMALLLAVVGGLGLMGTMSINVIERTREIGVMRAIGASDWAILQIFMVEGVLIGMISWLIGALLALPLSKLMSDAVGIAFLQAPLSYVFSLQGALLWLGIVVLLAAFASFLPAWNASRLTVRDVLAYE